MQDSLQLSPKRKSVSPSAKDQKQRTLLQQVKQKFITALSKLQSSETRQIGIREIRLLIDRNREPDHLRLYLSVMKNLKIQGTSSSTKEHQILVFSILAEILKQNLVDPVDKPPSRVKTCFKIIQILHAYFKETTNTVQQACARVLIDLGKYTLGAQSPTCSLDAETLVTLLYAPLSSILKSGVDKASQSTASVCINQQLQYWKAHFYPATAFPKYREMFEAVCTDMLAVALRLNAEYHEIFMAITTVIEVKGIGFFSGKIVQFVSKILGVINKLNGNNATNSKASSQEISNFNNYMCKVNVCAILEKIGELVRDKPQIKAKLDELEVLASLEKASRNRVIQVQMAAARAIRVWNGEIISPDIREKRPSSSPRVSGSNFMSLEEARKQKKRERSNSKQEKLKLQRQLSHMQEDLNKLVKGGWGPHNRANNYVKKNTGVGGGYCSKMEESPSPKVNKSHKEHIEQLRRFIKDSSKQHGSKEKFVFYQQKKDNANGQSKTGQPNEVARSKRQTKENKNFQQGEQNMEFVMDEDQGDQNVYLEPESRYKNPYANEEISDRFDTEDREWLSQNKQVLNKINSQDLDGVIDQKQMKQLLKQEQQILDIQSKPQIQSRAITQKNKESRNSINGYGELTFNQNQQQKNMDNYRDNSTKQMPAKQRVKQIIQPKSNNKQQNSNHKSHKKLLQNDHVIEQKPLNNKQEKKVQMKPTDIKNKQLGYSKQESEADKIKKEVPSLKLKNVDEYEVSMESSQKMSGSIPIADILNQSDFEGLGWNPFAKADIGVNLQNTQKYNFGKRKASEPNEKHAFPKQQDSKDSLVLSLSKAEESRSRSPPKSPSIPAPINQSKKSQFSLNPQQQNNQNKYNSYNQKNEDSDEQILDQSKYQQSMSYGHRNALKQQVKPQERIEQYYKKSVQHGEQLDKKSKSGVKAGEADEGKNQVFQQLIKNPPKSHLPHRLDRASHLAPQSEVSEQNEQDSQSNENITSTWERVLSHVENNQINEAYTLTFDMDDPIYLLRLMLMTQTPLKKLTPANTRLLWEKFLEIYQHRFIDNIFVQMFTTANKFSGGKGLNNSLSVEEMSQLLVQLYELSGRTKGKLSFGAATLYNEIQESINGRTNKY